MMIKREKKDLLCLVADTPDGEFRELRRIPFTDAGIRKVRVFADTGGSTAPMDARISNIRIQAEEITGGLPKRERGTSWAWWHTTLLLCVLFGALGAAILIYRRVAHRAD